MAATKDDASAFFWEGVLAADVDRIAAIIRSGIFEPQNVRNPLFESAITHGLICLADLLGKLAADNRRIAFVDDIDQPEDGQIDITELVRRCRNAACHMNSGEHRLGTNRFQFCVQVGKGVLMRSNDVELQCDYHDDIAIFWGWTRLYVKRHFKRAFEEAKRALGNY